MSCNSIGSDELMLKKPSSMNRTSIYTSPPKALKPTTRGILSSLPKS